MRIKLGLRKINHAHLNLVKTATQRLRFLLDILEELQGRGIKGKPRPRFEGVDEVKGSLVFVSKENLETSAIDDTGTAHTIKLRVSERDQFLTCL